MKKMFLYTLEAIAFAAIFSAAFILYAIGTTPTEFIYYNF